MQFNVGWAIQRVRIFAIHKLVRGSPIVPACATDLAVRRRLKGNMDGINVRRLAEAVRDGDLPAVTAILDARPELVAMDMAENDEHQVLHHAVLNRRPEIVRALIQRGADPRKGIWPHRDATSALTIASERDYSEIVEIIRQEEARRSRVEVPLDSSVEQQLTRAYQQDDESAFLGILESRPTLVQAADPASGVTALHLAAACLWERTAVWLVGQGARIDAADSSGRTPLDLLGSQSELSSAADRDRAAAIASHLLAAGAEPNARAAVSTGRVDILRARHARGDLARERGLLTHAVRSQQPGSVAVLLELGLDPDERGRVENVEEVVQSWGEPLRSAPSAATSRWRSCCSTMAPSEHDVYASSSAMYEAFARQDRDMIALLESHGGVVTPTGAGYLGMLERARQLSKTKRQAASLPARPARTAWRLPCWKARRTAATSRSSAWRSTGSTAEGRLALDLVGDAPVRPALDRHPRSLRRVLPAHRRSIRRRSRGPFRPDAAARRRRELAAHLADGSSRARYVRRHAARSRRAPGPAGRDSQEHAARLGLPLGAHRARATAA